MYEGQVLTFGRDAQINTGSNDLSVSRVHYTIRKTANGWEVYNGTNPIMTEGQIVAFNNGNILPFVSGRTYPSGTSFIPKLNVTGEGNFYGVANQSNVIGLQKITGKTLPDLHSESLNFQQNGKTFLFNVSNSSILSINGIYAGQLSQANREAIGNIIASYPGLISSITFVDSIGREVSENGQIGKKINTVYDSAGNVFVDSSLLQDPQKLGQALQQIANRIDLYRRINMTPSNNNDFRGYTQVFQYRSENNPNQIRLPGDSRNPYGIQVSIVQKNGTANVGFRPVITGGYSSTDTGPIKDGVVPSLYDGSERPNYVVTGSILDLRSKQFLSQVQNRLSQQNGFLNGMFRLRTQDPITVEQILTDANNYTRANFFDPSNLPYSDVNLRDSIPDRFAMSNINSNVEASKARLPFDSLYDSQGVYFGNGQSSKDKFMGVCKHQSIFLKYVLDDLVSNGILPEGTKIFLVSNQTTRAGHAFVRVELTDGRVWILDPRNNVSADLRNLVNTSWKYSSQVDDIGIGAR